MRRSLVRFQRWAPVCVSKVSGSGRRSVKPIPQVGELFDSTLAHHIEGMNNIPIPPTHMMFDGPQDPTVFVENGQEFLRYYKELCGLHPNERMLDVGSGIGRKTIPLTGYLSEAGSYEGIDPVADGVKWCQENITSQYQNFRFRHIDVYAPGYNPFGEIKPIDFRFPFEDAEFDFVMLGSVFTHMRYADMRHYLHEVARVLKPGGRCLITYFIGQGTFQHSHTFGWMANPAFPEEAISYNANIIGDMYADCGLWIERIEHGNWSGHEGTSYQDMILGRKP